MHCEKNSECSSACGDSGSEMDGKVMRFVRAGDEGLEGRSRERLGCRHPGPIYNCHGNRRQTSVVDLLPGLLVSLICFSFMPGFVTGLQCYECLSLECSSGVICESIKSSINRTFVPNSHYIHFNPRILCPGSDVPINSSEWDAVAFNCSRSDSLCLEAPVEVITAFDGLENGKKLDYASLMTSLGILRGCASRRGLLELPGQTISVRKIYLDNETEEIQKHGKYNDGYKIHKIHYHEIYVDHGTRNATRCYQDDCNNRKKLRMRGDAPRSVKIEFSILLASTLVFLWNGLP